MDIRITQARLGGSVPAPASKSQAHRLLICSALADVETIVKCPERSADIDATAGCLEALGASVSYSGLAFEIKPINTLPAGKITLGCGESGSTLRFLLPLACALGAKAELTLGGRLPERPLSPLYEELAAHGCALSGQGSAALSCSGTLMGGDFALPGNVSSQFISGLLFALPLLAEDSAVIVSGKIESKPYIDMTVSALGAFGVEITCANGRYHIKGNQRYRSPGTASAEGDWSNAAFWLCAGAVGSLAVTCTNLRSDSLQGDRAVLDILSRFGADVKARGDAVTVSRGRLRGIEIDAADIPDLVPVLAAVASVAEGKTVIKNAGRLRLKESDRLRAAAELLAGLGADIRETESGLEINGKARLEGGTADSFGDHRMAMTAAVAACACLGPVTIRNAGAVSKSYPGFFTDFASLGGNCEEIL